MNKAILSVGCNHHRSKHISQVTALLRNRYPKSRFSTPEMTQPIDAPQEMKPFLNMVAVIYTTESREEFSAFLKKTEKEFGRDPDDEEEGIIAMDLDLLEWNDEVFKPQDFVRSYIVAGLGELDEL